MTKRPPTRPPGVPVATPGVGVGEASPRTVTLAKAVVLTPRAEVAPAPTPSLSQYHVVDSERDDEFHDAWDGDEKLIDPGETSAANTAVVEDEADWSTDAGYAPCHDEL